MVAVVSAYDRLRRIRGGFKIFGSAYLSMLLQHSRRAKEVAIMRPWGTIFLRPSDSDFDVYNQIFNQKEYDLGRFPQWRRIQDAYEAILATGRTPIIVDAGANIGFASVWFALKFPEARILSVEPDPENVALARKNTAPFSNIAVIEAAIGAEAGRVTLTQPEGASWAVTTERSESGDVAIVTIDSLMANAGAGAQLLMAKFDIEGFEKDVFSTNLDWLNTIPVLMVEPHDWMRPGEGTSAPLLSAVAGRGLELLILGENLVFVR